MLQIRVQPAPELTSRIEELATLRIQVFREWPYLYDGTLKYERAYLATYLENPAACLITVESNGKIIGMSTCVPLVDEVAEFREPIEAVGRDPAAGLYFGESVLLPAFRGRGIGRVLMDERLKIARSMADLTFACFCAVIRDPGDSRKPDGYRLLDGFWRKSGFQPLAAAQAHFSWLEIGGSEETAHPMQFWIRELAD